MRMLSNRLASSFFSSYKYSSEVKSTVKIGDVLQQRKIFTDEDVVAYSKVSDDINPLHFDTECAHIAGFQDRLVHGMLVASLFPRIISSHFPGAVYVSQNLQFRQPVYVGDEIVGEVQAMNIRNFKTNYLVKFSTRCLKKGSLLVIDGEATAILPSLIMQ
ncbi:3-hydroxyacyl-[acyl-carrier-protein] dehydratase FERN, mitochondrial [Spinacia oleracea]|uniref:3-hydroxyacyl-[acyl-carrier-protein] dehydratase FERN, mitochondrial n=1 Tax=Spinacia oleracea TaxID=3562 RepID=A0A9R0K1F6_SPIOL|nr:3-hydroxyacyl-[acyl-carrier-protein] dehydratase FERN, mitochondrial [Spinacia oleracea]XP_056685979.1 3-hydroxyacyl-[acyl-carrier-protein] dehydratase FERN, mitochondrial [Spinacia oleracea]XP_056685982.1 3-hydroxyacyl-[acyl-carrier-protein] dehydratase FERN, mitochondrial [Spinacia oleracea]